jgi:hypothetical protein
MFCINNLNSLPGNSSRRLDRGDAIAFDEQIRSGKFTQLFVHCDDGCATDQGSRCHVLFLRAVILAVHERHPVT